MIEVHFLKRSTSSINGEAISYRDKISAYTHTISANGGYTSANVSLLINKNDMFDLASWLVGTTMEVFSNDTDVIWIGFVNEISVSIGNEQRTFGPFLDIANRVLVRFTEFNTGVTGTTTYANDLTSQANYGTMTKILSGGNISASNADKIRDKYLYENSKIKVSKSISSSTGISFDVTCLGYYDLLSTYVYNNTNTSTTTVSSKIISVLQAHPNTLFNYSGYGIESNTLSVSNFENSDKSASDIIRSLVSLGDDATNLKTIFGLYGNNPYYRTITPEVLYFLEDSINPVVTSYGGGIIDPHKLKPGHYIESNSKDSLSASFPNNSTAFIDSISYTYPNQFQITCGYSGDLSQQLAKLGVGGSF